MNETSRTKRDDTPAGDDAHAPLSRGTVLVVEDELAVARGYKRVLTALGYKVLTAGDGETGRALFDSGTVDAVISDLSMPGADGFELLSGIHAADPHMPVIIATGEREEQVAARAVEGGALLVLTKPIDVRALGQVVEHAMRVRRAQPAPEAHPEPARVTVPPALTDLEVAYQPVVDAARGVIVGYEALVGSKENGLADARAVFAAAAQAGCVVEVGRAIRARVAADLAGAPATAQIFVSLPAEALADDALHGPQEPLRAFAKQVVFEISQREALEHCPRVVERLEDLREAGFRLCLDGLGSGYAVLSAFVKIRPSVVKVDAALVRNLHAIAFKRRIVGAVASMCRQMRVALVAEGVDTDAERAALLELCCDLQQGLAHGPPGRGFTAAQPRSGVVKRTQALTVRPAPRGGAPTWRPAPLRAPTELYSPTRPRGART